MTENIGWRSFWWFNTALIAVSLIQVIFSFPETKWHRQHPSEIVAKLTPKENTTTESPITSDAEKHNTTLTQTHTTTSTPPYLSQLTAAATADRDPQLGRGTPSKQQWKLYQPNTSPFRAILLDLWIPWKLFMFPIIEFSAFVTSWSCSCFLTLNLTQSQNFAAPPYNYNPQTIGFFNFAVLGGALIGLATAGPLSDWVSARATRKNRGIREPEMRLPAMIPYVLIMILGNFVAAFGYEYNWPAPVIVVIAFGCAGLQVAALPAMATTYAIDSYKPVAGSVMVAVTVNKNLWGYGFAEFITEWIIRDGYVPPIMTNMGLTTLWCLFGVLFWYFGKMFRRWSKDDGVHRM